MDSLLMSIRPTEIVKHHVLTTDYRKKAEALAEGIWSDVGDTPDLLDAVVEGCMQLGEMLRDELTMLADECPSGVTKLLLTFSLNLVQWHVVSYPFFVTLAQREAAFRATPSGGEGEEENEAYFCDSIPFAVREDTEE
jgi:hypothetical protein